MVDILSFKVSTLPNDIRFKLPKIESICYPFRMSRPKVDWLQPNTLTLNNQVTNEYISLLQLQTVCSSDDINLKDIIFTDLHEYQLTASRDILAEKFMRRIEDYTEVYSRDQDAFEQFNFNVELNAIVLTYNGEYYGHIYCWISPIEKIVLAMGIRNRVDNIFLKGTDKYLPDVSGYLLEGVRNFALSNGIDQMIIVTPLPIMRNILSDLGFKMEFISSKIIGQSISPDNCSGFYCFTQSTNKVLKSI